MTENEYLLQAFYQIITPHKKELFERVASQRTRHLVVALENIQQDHNASAIMRSMDCLGFHELHLIEKHNKYEFQRDIALGAARWLNIVQHHQSDQPILDAIKKLRTQGYRIVATSPHTKQNTLMEIPIDKPVALFFGAEKNGISEQLKNNADTIIQIPMYGFTESLNLSVSVALLLNMYRSRLASSKLNWLMSNDEQTEIKLLWCQKILNGGPELAEKFRSEYKKV